MLLSYGNQCWILSVPHPMLINPLISRRSSCCWKLLRVQFQENKEESQYVLAGKVYRSSSIDGERNVGDSPHYHRPRSRVHSQNPQNHSLKAARPPPTIGSKSPGNSSTVEEQTSKSWAMRDISDSVLMFLAHLLVLWLVLMSESEGITLAR